MEHLTSKKVSSIGTEWEFGVLMSVGYTVDEVKTIYLRRNKWGHLKNRKYSEAPSWISRMAREVAADQAAMTGEASI
jgi:hypothetical protein